MRVHAIFRVRGVRVSTHGLTIREECFLMMNLHPYIPSALRFGVISIKDLSRGTRIIADVHLSQGGSLAEIQKKALTVQSVQHKSDDPRVAEALYILSATDHDENEIVLGTRIVQTAPVGGTRSDRITWTVDHTIPYTQLTFKK